MRPTDWTAAISLDMPESFASFLWCEEIQLLDDIITLDAFRADIRERGCPSHAEDHIVSLMIHRINERRIACDCWHPTPSRRREPCSVCS